VTDVQVLTDIAKFFDYIHDPLIKLLTEHINHFNGISVRIRMLTNLRDTKSGDLHTKYLSTGNMSITHLNFIDSTVHFILAYILKQLDYYNSNGSGHEIESIENVIVTIGPYQPIEARGNLPIPACLKSRRGLLNIKGQDGFCFKYCITANFCKNELEKIYELIKKLNKEPTKGSGYIKSLKAYLQDGSR